MLTSGAACFRALWFLCPSLLSLLDSIRGDIARGCDSFIKPGASARQRGLSAGLQREPLPAAWILPQLRLPWQVPCRVPRKGRLSS